MGFLRNGLMAAAVGLAGLAAAPAQAVTMKAVYEGKIYSSTDQDGFWGNGTGNGPLNGLDVLVEVIFDPTLGFRQTGTFGVVALDSVYGGTTTAAPDFISSVLVTVNGITRAVDWYKYSLAQAVDDNSTYSRHYLLSYDFTYDPNSSSPYSNSSYFAAQVNDLSGVIPADLEAPFTWEALTTTNERYGAGSFQFYDSFSVDNGHTGYTEAAFTITRATITRVGAPPPPPVPLPASALLLLGAGGGLMLLGRRRRAA